MELDQEGAHDGPARWGWMSDEEACENEEFGGDWGYNFKSSGSPLAHGWRRTSRSLLRTYTHLVGDK
eukprot:4256678-Prymnesium_polylepis.1